VYEFVAVVVGAVVNVFIELIPSYVSITDRLAVTNASICAPVELAVVVWLLLPTTKLKTGADFLAFEYVISLEELMIVPPPSLYFTNKVKEPLSADNVFIE
jgi:hypothetical protein